MLNYHNRKDYDTLVLWRPGQACRRALLIIFTTLLMVGCVSTPEPASEPKALVLPTQEQQAKPVIPAINYNQRRYQTALKALKKGETGIAIELLEQVSSKTPDIDFVFTNLGLAYFKTSNYDKAERSLQKAILLNSKDTIALNHLGIIKRMRGEFQGAKETYMKAIAIDDEYARTYFNLGILYDMYLQDLELALVQYQKYQTLTNNENKTVTKWIVDIERRIKSIQSGVQG